MKASALSKLVGLGVLLALLNVTAAGVEAADSRRSLAGGADEAERPPPFDPIAAQRLGAEFSARLAAITTAAEIEWRITEFLLDPRLEDLLVRARGHLVVPVEQDFGADEAGDLEGSHRRLAELFQWTTRTALALNAIPKEKLHAWAHAEGSDDGESAEPVALPRVSSLRELLYGDVLPRWYRVRLFQGVAAYFSYSVLLEEEVSPETERLLAHSAEAGFVQLLELTVAMLRRFGEEVPGEALALAPCELDVDKLTEDDVDEERAFEHMFENA